MKLKVMIQAFYLVAIVGCCLSQVSNDATPVLGQWEGGSICTVANTPCHDEHVIYRITRDAKSPAKLTLAAQKVVNGEELYMGDLDCRYIADKSELNCHYKPTDAWVYKLSGDKMEGTLTINGSTLYRRINVKRVPATPVK